MKLLYTSLINRRRAMNNQPPIECIDLTEDDPTEDDPTDDTNPDDGKNAAIGNQHRRSAVAVTPIRGLVNTLCARASKLCYWTIVGLAVIGCMETIYKYYQWTYGNQHERFEVEIIRRF